MNYRYVGSGGVNVGGCATVKKTVFEVVKFAEGSTVFNVHAARRGKIETITIKYVRLINNKKTLGQTIHLYVDTLNGLWNENELVVEEDAQALVQDFLDDQLAEIKALSLKCRIRNSSAVLGTL
jgi:hypothetical protein